MDVDGNIYFFITDTLRDTPDVYNVYYNSSHYGKGTLKLADAETHNSTHQFIISMFTTLVELTGYHGNKTNM